MTKQPRGDFRVSRAVFDHPALTGDPYDRISAWLYLIAEAGWNERGVNRNGRLIMLRRGQLAASQRFLAERWGWERKRAARFLEQLEQLGMIHMEIKSGFGVITISNYEQYQGSQPWATDGPLTGPLTGPQTGPQTGPLKNGKSLSATGYFENDYEENGPLTGPLTGHRTGHPPTKNRAKTYTHNQESKNQTRPKGSTTVATKVVAEREIASGFEEWWPIYPRKEAKKAARVAYGRVLRKGEATIAELLAGAKRYAAECAGKERRYIKLPAGWLNDGRWADERATPSGRDDGKAVHDYWVERVEKFKREGKWSSIGAAPGQPGCKVPPDVLERFGYPAPRGPPP